MPKIRTIASLMICLNASLAARAQVYSPNIVGFYNLTISPGDNLIANQFSYGADNTLNTVLQYGTVLTGSTFTEWNPTTRQFLPQSVFDGTSWSINYDFSPNGIGGVLNSPGTTTVTFAGTVPNYNINTGYTFVPPTRPPGAYLLSLAAPLSTGSFQQVVGRDPIIGDFVETLDATTQTYTTTTYDGSAWDNGTPSLAVGQSAFFGLGGVEVPEPSTFALAGFGLVVALGFRRMRWFGTSREAGPS